MSVAICPIFVSLFLYADDILLIAPSVSALQTLLNVCEEELKLLDMQLNIQKYMCIRFGARFRVRCNSLASSFGGVVDWNTSCKYLGVYFVSGRTFKCCFDHAKSQFFSDHLFIASEEVVISLNHAVSRYYCTVRTHLYWCEINVP